NAVEPVAALLSAVQAGHAVLPTTLDPLGDAFALLVDRYRPEWVVLSGTGDPAWAAAYTENACGGLRQLRRRNCEASPLHPDLAVLLTTSGSTGSPKLVRLSRRAVAANARQIAAALAMTSQDRAVSLLPLGYSFGLSVLNSHLQVGGSVVLTDRSPVEAEFWADAAACAVTTLPGVPFTFDMLRRVGAAARAPASLRRLLQAGGRMASPMIAWTREAFAAQGVELVVMYGQTEACARMSVLPPAELAGAAGAVGYAVPEGRFTINADGEVIYSGPNVMMGYAETRADLAKGDELGGVLATGDLGRLDERGRLWLSGRIKRIAKPFGLRVSLDDIEAALAPFGSLAVAGDDTILWVVVERGDLDALRASVAALAARMKLPPSLFRIRPVPALPRGTNGKVLYGQLLVEP
ncbi:MAG TPA: AMP-binding protein, partial [Patescibacteria group bacterium]|nr:AMP-binding protein [Patescibacteria group bacterium]